MIMRDEEFKLMVRRFRGYYPVVVDVETGGFNKDKDALLEIGAVTLKIDDSINEKFLWLLDHFSDSEIKILDQDKFISDDEYLRSIHGMVESIKEARNEPKENGVTLDKLDW